MWKMSNPSAESRGLWTNNTIGSMVISLLAMYSLLINIIKYLTLRWIWDGQ
jgi:hypothetical protein